MKMNRPLNRRRFLATAAVAGVGVTLTGTRAAEAGLVATKESESVPRWGLFEIPVANERNYANPFADVTLEASFTAPSGGRLKAFGFYEGEKTWCLRFMPDEAGSWRYEAKFSDGASGVTGSFQCVQGNLHGPLRVRRENSLWFEHADATPFFVRAFHLWRVDALDEATWGKTLDFLKAQGFNAVVGPHLAPPDRLPWQRNQQGKLDFARFNLAVWRNLDRALDKLAKRGMVLIPFNLFGGTNGMPKIPTEADEDLFLRYWVARWSGFWNATFQPTSEWEEEFSEAHILRLGARLRELDGGRHLVSVHALKAGSRRVQEAAWYDYHTVQDKLTDHNFARYWSSTRLLHAQVPKPVLAHEHLWEGNRYQKEAGLDPHNLRRAAWVLTLAGAAINYADEVAPPRRHSHEEESYASRGAAMQPLGLTYPYLKILGDFIESLCWWEMKPASDVATPGFCLANPGKAYVVYLPEGGATVLTLPPGTYRANWLNPRDGKLGEPFAVEGGGQRKFQAPDENDWTLLLRK
jgi:hypothetical protein